MRSSNPFLREQAIKKANHRAMTEAGDGGIVLDSAERMTVDGTTTKVAICLLVVAAGAALSWNLVANGTVAAAPLMMGGGILGLILSLIISFKPKTAPILTVPFALAEGLMLGAISLMYTIGFYTDIVTHAELLTISVSLGMFLLWRSGIVKVTDKMRSIVGGAMFAVFLTYLLTWILGMFGVSVPYIHGSGPIGIGFSALVIVIVAFMLMVDFDMIDRLAKGGAPKAMEWYGAFALLVTLVWLYLELLRLLSKLQSRD